MWFENCCFRRAHLSRHIFTEISFPQKFEWIFFFLINCFAPAVEIFSCWEEHPSPPNVVTLIFKCSSFAFSMGHRFLPCCVEALSLPQKAGCPCHDYFVLALTAAVVSGASTRFCCTILFSGVFKMLPCAPADVWGWHTVGARIKGCSPSAHQLWPSGHFLGNKSIP